MAGESELEKLRRENEALKKQLEEKPGLSGWVVNTPNPRFSERTCGVQFRNGVAFVPNIKGMDEVIKVMTNDFGYTARFVDNWQENPISADVKTSIVDTYSIPQILS